MGHYWKKIVDANFSNFWLEFPTVSVWKIPFFRVVWKRKFFFRSQMAYSSVRRLNVEKFGKKYYQMGHLWMETNATPFYCLQIFRLFWKKIQSPKLIN